MSDGLMDRGFFADKWKSLSGLNKLLYALLFTMVIMLPPGIYYAFAERELSVLFTDLNQEDTAKIISMLDKEKIYYEYDNNTIYVDDKDVHKTRLNMMSQGLTINGGVGYEIFDKSEFGMTEFAQRINYQRALQGELTRTIMALEEVIFSRVHLVLPESGLFTDNKSTPSASVTLFLSKGRSIKKSQVIGIQKLVAASVDKLDYSMVTVSNDKGEILSSNGHGMHGAQLIESQLDLKIELEQYLTKKALSVIDKVLGEGSVFISVDAAISYDTKKLTKEGVIPNKTVDEGIIKKRETKITSTKSKKDTTGNSTTEIEYKLGKKIEQLVESPGRIIRLSVAVIVKNYMINQDIEKVRDLVAMSVGLNESRGDVITVQHITSLQGPNSNLAVDAQNPKSVNVVAESEKQTLLRDSGAYNDFDHKTHTTDQSNEGNLISLIKDRKLILSAIAALVLILLTALIWTILNSRHRNNQIVPMLSNTEREKVLEQLKDWIEAEQHSANKEVKVV